MKIIYNIAKAELQILFYSPIAWLILIIFTVQSGLVFSDSMAYLLKNKELGYGLYSATLSTFTGFTGLFPAIQKNIYFYIPLLTMGLMSRELASGSIKLLYSSPVTSIQIILGKYLSMMFYGAIMMMILGLFVAYSSFVICDIDLSVALSGMLGLYLLICTYAAIGLFMSCLTSYQVVAAIGTLTVLSILNYIGHVWQSIEIVRDITYWFSINGRADELINGLICSDDILYFVIVTALFLALTIHRLNTIRQNVRRSVSMARYLLIIVCAVGLGYISSRPFVMKTYDTTDTKLRTLTPASQKIISQMKGGMTITNYVNILDRYNWVALPQTVNEDRNRMKQYTRFKPEIKMKYVYYYNTTDTSVADRGRSAMKKTAEIYKLDTSMVKTPEEVEKVVDLRPEHYRFVRLLERDNGNKTFLRIFDDSQIFPSESQITAAFKRLIMKLPTVAFVKGHGERDGKRTGDRDYNCFAEDKFFRYSLVNQGFDFAEVELDRPIADGIDVLVIADMKSALTPAESDILEQYIARGGNLIIAGEPRRREVMNPLLEKFGVAIEPGCIVQTHENFQPDFLVAKMTKEAHEISYFLEENRTVTMPGCAALTYTADRGYQIVPLVITPDKDCWNELETTDMVDGKPTLNPELNEQEKSWPVALALSRKVGEKEQKIVITGDADFLSNGELTASRKNISASNFNLAIGVFHWMSDGETPIDIRRPYPSDNRISIEQRGLTIIKWLFTGIIPALLLLAFILIWIRRSGK